MSTDTQHDTMTTEKESFPLDGSGEVRLPVVEILTGRGFITGKSGSGKSNSASVVAEELLGRGFPLLVVDTDGEYWGLKEEYEILHVGADEECDLQVGPEHAEKLAELALDQNVPIILDVSGFIDEADANDLIRETARHLFAKEKKLKKPFLLLVEEVHEYIPEGAGLDETGQMLVKIGKRGRKHGLGLVGISQRPANVKKDFITQANWLLWHRLTWENDTQVVRRVVDSEHADAVSDLADGEAFLQADFLDEDVQRVQVRRKETFDAGATPGLDDFERPDLKSVSGDLVDELEEISEREERRQDRIAQLESELEDREETIEELREELEQARDISDMAQQFTQALTASGGDAGQLEAKVEEMREEKNQRIRELEAEVEDRKETIEGLRDRVAELEEYEQRAGQLDGLDLDEAEEALLRLSESLGLELDGDAEKWKQKFQQERERRQEAESTPQRAPVREPDAMENPKVKRYLSEMHDRIKGLDDKELLMLHYYRLEGPAGTKDAYKYAGGSPTSGTRNEKNKTLLDANLVRKIGRGEYAFGLRNHAENRLGDHFEDDVVGAVVRELDEAIDQRLESAEKM